MPDTITSSEGAICPHCGDIDRDAREYFTTGDFPQRIEALCGSCGQKYLLEADTEEAYDSRDKEGDRWIWHYRSSVAS
jgi:hypothetical protein